MTWITNKLHAVGVFLILLFGVLAEILRRRGDHWKEKAEQREAA